VTPRRSWPGFGARARDVAVFATAFALAALLTGSVLLGLLAGALYAAAVALPIPNLRDVRARRLQAEALRHAHRPDQRVDRVIGRHWPAPDDDRTRRS